MTIEPKQLAKQLIETPCQNICVVDTETGECIGCGRTRAEIAGWLKMTPDQRKKIAAELDERMATLTSRKKRKGGAARRRARETTSKNSPDKGILSFPIDVTKES